MGRVDEEALLPLVEVVAILNLVFVERVRE